jgi:hypothetical protein
VSPVASILYRDQPNETKPSNRTIQLVQAANQLVQMSSSREQLLKAAHDLLQMPDSNDYSTEILTTIHKLLEKASTVQNRETVKIQKSEFKESILLADSDKKEVNIPIANLDRLSLKRHSNLPYFSLKPSNVERLPVIESKSKIKHPLPVGVPEIRSRPSIPNLSKNTAQATLKSTISKFGVTAHSRMAAVHNPSAKIPSMMTRSTPKRLGLESSSATDYYNYIFIWTDPSTGEEMDVFVNRFVSLQILIQMVAATTSSTSTSFQFSFPLGNSTATDPNEILQQGAHNVTAVQTLPLGPQDWTVSTSTSNSSPYIVTVSNSSGLNSGSLLTVTFDQLQISNVAGLGLITISESISNSYIAAPIIKSPNYFVLKNMYFTTSSNGSGTPIGTVLPGTNIYVTWTMYNPGYVIKLYWDSEFVTSSVSSGVDVSNLGSGKVTYQVAIPINSSTTFTLIAQTNGDYYQIQARASSLALQPPTGLTGISTGPNTVNLTWIASTGAQTYEVVTNDGRSTTAEGNSNTKASFNNLSQTTSYQFSIRSFAPGNMSALSSPITVTTLTLQPPIGITSSNITSNSCSLTWPAAVGAVEYTVTWSTGNGQFSGGAAAGRDTYTCQILHMDSSATYNFQVYSVGLDQATGKGYQSSNYTSFSVTTQVGLPQSPASSMITSFTTTSATLSWTPVTNVSTYYIGYFSFNTSTMVYSSALSGTTGTISGLSPGTKYDLGVYSSNSVGMSGSAPLPSNYNLLAFYTESITIPPAVTYSTSSHFMGNKQTLVFWDQSPGCQTYAVYYAAQNTTNNFILASNSIPASATSYIVTMTYEPLGSGKSVSFQVTASNTAGTSTPTITSASS